MTPNEAQARAIAHVDGPMMVIAGPGSGKTTVITKRIQYLIQVAGVDASKILVITFTKAAATEMRQRFTDMMQESALRCTFGTFHGIFFTILRVEKHYASQNVLLEGEKIKILRDIVRDMKLDYVDEDEYIRDVISEISIVKAELYDIENYYSKNIAEDTFRAIYKAYHDKLKVMRKIDFDDMLVDCYRLLSDNPAILKRWQSRYSYILVDEFQDINSIQYRIVRMLAAPKNNLFIVGDDDQSIYGFRGAKSEIMLGFPEDYPNTEQVFLQTNYRCSRQICAIAGRLIGHNVHRFPKEIVAMNDYQITVRHCTKATVRDENEDIIENIKRYKEQGIPYEKMAVLFRTNNQSRSIAQTLAVHNIPIQIRDDIASFYDNYYVQDILTYIKIARGDDSRQSFLRIINKPLRYIKRDYFDTNTVDLYDMINEFYRNNMEWAVEKIETLLDDLDALHNMAPYAAIQYIRNVIGYDDYIEECGRKNCIPVISIYQVLDEMAELAKSYNTYQEWFDAIEKYEDKLKSLKNNSRDNTVGVVLSTMHSAKGLEFEAVFIIDVNEDVVPYKKAVDANAIEEERRMFYVAMTRAKKYLCIYSVSELYGKEMHPSRFIKELEKR